MITFKIQPETVTTIDSTTPALLDRRDFLAGSAGAGAMVALGAEFGHRGGGPEDLHHPAHQRHSLQSYRRRPGFGVHAGDAQRRQNDRRHRTHRHADCRAQAGPRSRRAGARARYRRFSIGTPFGGAIQQTGAELQCLSLAGYDATTFGNHEFDSGPAALAKAMSAARKAGRVPAILAANMNYDAADAHSTA